MCIYVGTHRHTLYTHTHSPGVEIRGQTQVAVFTLHLVQDEVSCLLLCPPSLLAHELPRILCLYPVTLVVATFTLL